MNKKKVLVVLFIISLVIITIVFCINKYNKKEESNEDNIEYVQIDKNQISYNPNATVSELKNDVGLQGKDEIYEIQNEFDGRRVLNVKCDLKYEVAFCGMIKKSEPKEDELDEIMQKEFPNKNGIWIYKSSREKIIELINKSSMTNSEYFIDENGYLNIKEKNIQTESDLKLENAINGKKTIILCISSICYIIDEVTGQYLDYNFEKMDKCQVYEYFKDSNENALLFITENNNKIISNEEIFTCILLLL